MGKNCARASSNLWHGSNCSSGYIDLKRYIRRNRLIPICVRKVCMPYNNFQIYKVPKSNLSDFFSQRKIHFQFLENKRSVPSGLIPYLLISSYWKTRIRFIKNIAESKTSGYIQAKESQFQIIIFIKFDEYALNHAHLLHICAHNARGSGSVRRSMRNEF